MKTLKLGLFSGIPETSEIQEHIFEYCVNPTDIILMHTIYSSKLYDCDNLELYISDKIIGAISIIPLVELFNYCFRNNISLTLWIYNKNTSSYQHHSIVDNMRDAVKDKY